MLVSDELLSIRNLPQIIGFSVLILCLFIWIFQRLRGFNNDFPLVNRKYALEPTIFSRWRWTTDSRRILKEAIDKYPDTAFRLIRGDRDVIVIPSKFVPELNAIPGRYINSQLAHSQALTGHLNGVNIILNTNSHVKWINAQLTPSIASQWEPLRQRVTESIDKVFPQEKGAQATLDSLDAVATCVGRAMSFFAWGPPLCDKPEIEDLGKDISKGLFGIVLAGRMLPPILQKPLIWLFPIKWQYERTWRTLKKLSADEIERRRTDSKPSSSEQRDFATWLLKEGHYRSSEEELEALSRLTVSIMAGGLFSTTAVVSGTLLHLAASRSNELNEIRAEIRAKHASLLANSAGKDHSALWDHDAQSDLPKLDSALKEFSRVMPASTLIYGRAMLASHTLSNGQTLRAGDHIYLSGYGHCTDAAVYPQPDEYRALRTYEADKDIKNTDKHHTASEPWQKLDNETLRWGSGRWACPGRYTADVVAKMILVRLIDEYDFAVADDRPLSKIYLHEFGLMDPELRLIARQRDDSLGIW